MLTSRTRLLLKYEMESDRCEPMVVWDAAGYGRKQETLRFFSGIGAGSVRGGVDQGHGLGLGLVQPGLSAHLSG